MKLRTDCDTGGGPECLILLFHYMHFVENCFINNVSFKTKLQCYALLITLFSRRVALARFSPIFVDAKRCVTIIGQNFRFQKFLVLLLAAKR